MIIMLASPQALETNLAAGGHLDTYEFEGPDRAEFVQDLAEFQLAAVRACLPLFYPTQPCWHVTPVCATPGAVQWAAGEQLQ